MCLFSLDKHAAIPVDTHVWQLAARYYTPHLKGVPSFQVSAFLCKLILDVQPVLWETLGINARRAGNRALCWPISGRDSNRA